MRKSKFIENNFNVINPEDYLQNSTTISCLKDYRESILSYYNLINEFEISQFIENKPNLMKLIEKITNLIKISFKNNLLSMEFVQDPEIEEIKQIIIYIHSNDSFDKDWDKLKKLNEEIQQLIILDNSMKRLIDVDLW